MTETTVLVLILLSALLYLARFAIDSAKAFTSRTEGSGCKSCGCGKKQSVVKSGK